MARSRSGRGVPVYHGRGTAAAVAPSGELVKAAQDITTGAVFRQINKSGRVGGRLSDQSIYNIIHDVAERAGLAGIRPHSLRAGGATGAYLGGADPLLIARHGRWRDGSRMVNGYIRDIDRWTHNPLRGSGL